MHNLDLIVGSLDHLCVGESHAGFVLLKICDGGVEGKIAFQEEAVCLPLLCDHGKAVVYGFFRAVKVCEPPVKVNTARCSGADTEYGFQKFGSSGTYQAVQAEDLALTHIEGDILKMRCKLGRQVLYRQDHILGTIIHRREAVFQGTSNHGGDQLVHIGFLGTFCHNQLAVPEYGYLVTDFKDLIHLVGDVDQRNTLVL